MAIRPDGRTSLKVVEAQVLEQLLHVAIRPDGRTSLKVTPYPTGLTSLAVAIRPDGRTSLKDVRKMAKGCHGGRGYPT